MKDFSHHLTYFLKPRKIAIFRHCEEGHSPDEAIQCWQISWITAPSSEARDDEVGKTVGW